MSRTKVCVSGVGLRDRRRRWHMTQEDLAKAVSCRRETIARIEAGSYSPSVGLAMRICRELGCRVEDVFELSDRYDYDGYGRVRVSERVW